MINEAVRRYRRKARLGRDAGIIGNVEWAEYFNGWFDDVSQFSAESSGHIRLNKLGIAIPREIALWLLGRNPNYGYCLDLAAQGVVFSVEPSGLAATYNGVRFVVEQDTLFILWELVVQNAYRWAPLAEPSLIFDIGMNVGFSSLIFALRDPAAQVVGFEPFRNTYERLTRNLALNPHLAARISAQNIGLSDHDAEETWNLCSDNSALSSQFPDEWIAREIADTAAIAQQYAEQWSAHQIPVQVNLRSASAAMLPVLNAQPHRKCIVKMDCEGSEYAIFDDWAKSGIHSRIDLLIMEYHEQGEHRLAELEQWFQANGFMAVIQPQRMYGKELPYGSIIAFHPRHS